MEIHPPKWADRFLAWYCNPDLLEEIQGDAYELYFDRVRNEGKASADRKYIFDVMRFFRWSNIRRARVHSQPGYLGVLWNLNFKIAIRHTLKNRFIFFIRMVSLSVSLAFALFVWAFVIQELTFDQFHRDHDRIFRIGHKVGVEGSVTNYAVSAMALANGLEDEVPEIEDAFTVVYRGKPAFYFEDRVFDAEVTLQASPGFLRVLTFDFVYGNSEALDDPYKIVLTEETATKFFGDRDPLGQTIDMGWMTVEVGAVIKDVPENSHLQFDAVVSWDTYDFNEGWDNINGYTYVMLSGDADIYEVHVKIDDVIHNHREEIEGGSEYRSGTDIAVDAIVENIADIHLGGYLDEDIAVKRNKTNVYILILLAILFFFTGLINFVNLSLADLTTSFKKIGILQVFGGAAADHNKIIITNSLFSVFVVIPMTSLVLYAALLAAESEFAIYLDGGVFTGRWFVSVAGLSLAVFIFSGRINSWVLSRSNDLVKTLKGKFDSGQHSLQLRGLLVAAQLSFSIVMIALILVMVDQFQFLETMDKGLEDRNTIVVKIPTDDFDATQQFIESVRSLSGVRNADGSSYYLDNIETMEGFEIETGSGRKKMLVAYMNCGYDYLDAMRIHIVQGRNFQPDRATDLREAYLINETAAREFGWKEPLGKSIWGPLDTDRHGGMVIGVVRDFHFASMYSKVEPLIIFPVTPDWGIRYVYIKVNPIATAGINSRFEAEYHKHFGEFPFNWEYLDSKFLSLYKNDYEVGRIFQVGLGISILLSCMGVFSMSAFFLIMRSREMVIRKIVGASQMHLLILHMKGFARFMAIAVVVAGPAIYYLSQTWLDNFAYHIDLNASYFIVPAAITVFILLLTAGFHGIKTSRVNPVDVLKHE